MSQSTVGERLKFLADTLGMSMSAFSKSVGVPVTTTQNYVKRGTIPKSEYLVKITERFKNVNSNWLLTGQGRPFLDESSLTQTNISGNSNNVASGKGGKAIQKNYNLSDCEKERDSYKDKLEAAQREIELLTGQVQMQATIIRGKDEMLDLLRGSVNRPN